MSFWDRLTGRLVEAARLGQKKRAAATGILAFDGPLSDLRLEIAIKGHPWLQNTATTTLLLSTWAAQALQDMAAVLESTAKQRLGETGKLPEATFTIADGLYDASLNWIDLAQTALATIDAKTDFVMQLRLPAPAPRFDWVADAPPAHFVAAIEGVVQLGTAVEDALNNMENDRSRLPRKYDGAFESIGGTIRFARAKLDQVQAAESDRQAHPGHLGDAPGSGAPVLPGRPADRHARSDRSEVRCGCSGSGPHQAAAAAAATRSADRPGQDHGAAGSHLDNAAGGPARDTLAPADWSRALARAGRPGLRA